MNPVLVEVEPSDANVSLPYEVTREEDLEEWVAVSGGTFRKAATLESLKGLSLSTSPCCKPAVPIRKHARKKPQVSYFVNRCPNTKCEFPPGHAGQCSHMIVTGKRGGRA